MSATVAAASPAGFWKRYVAYAIDALIASGVSGAVSQVLLEVFDHADLERLQGIALSARQANDAAPPDPSAMFAVLGAVLWKLTLFSTATYVVIGGAYFALSEASSWQATLGKRLAGIHVVGPDGGRIGLPRAIARFFAAGLSWLTLNLGHAMAAIAPEHRALHDRIAGTRVENVDPGNTAMPAWGWIIIALTAGAFLLTVLLGVIVALGVLAQASQA